MRFWYFKFEGVFTLDSPIYSGLGVISNCLVPLSSHKKAESLFLYALKKNHIKLVEILDYSDVDAEELDPEDEVNTFWIDWYNETREKMEPVFDTFHTFKLEASTEER